MQSEIDEPIPPEIKKRRSIFFWLGRAIVFFVLLTVFLMIGVHLPPVQRWGIDKITANMGKTLNTRVALKGFSINPISDLVLHDIFIGSPEHPADTLIYAETLQVDYRRIWDLLKRRFTITQVGINQGMLNIHRIAGDSLTNLDLALLRLLPPKNPDKPDFVLALKSLTANSLSVRVDDESNGTLMNVFLKRADVELDTLDILGKYIDIRELDLDEPVIRIINRLPMPDSVTVTTGSSVVWNLDVDFWHLTNGQFYTDNRTKALSFYPDPRGIDYAHLSLTDVDIEMDSLMIRGWNFKGQSIDIHLLHQNGFEIQTLSADRAVVSREEVKLDNLMIKTADSQIHNSLVMEYTGYRDFQSFADSVRLDLPSADIRLKIGDLLAIAPGLQQVGFFKDNADKDLRLQGKVNGIINRLKISNMTAGLGVISMSGDFRSRNLAVAGSQLLSLDLDRSSFSAAGLKSIFPKMKVPAVLSQLGEINFNGKFDGYPDDFVAFGTFNTSLGSVTMDMNLNTINGLAKGKYAGTIAMQDFDLGKMLGQPDLGRISMSGRVIDGTGLTSSSLHADLTAELKSLTYKGYTYKNARVDGLVAGKLFNGTLDINDPNVDMHFEGYVDMQDSVPNLDFISRIDHIHFQPLGLTKRQVSLEGIFDVDINVGNVNQIAGNVIGDKVVLKVDSIDYTLDSIQVSAGIDDITRERKYSLRSDVMSGTISGEFNPALLPNQLMHYLHAHYPSAVDQPKILLKSAAIQHLSWDLKVYDSEGWFDLAGLEGLQLRNASTSGTLDLNESMSSGMIDLPEIHFGKINAYATSVQFSESGGQTDFDMELVAADLNEGIFFEDVFISGTATNDSMLMNFRTDQLADIINELDLDISAVPVGGSWEISFNPRKLVMFGDDWKVPAGNKVEIRKDEFNIDNFELVSSDKKIILEDIGNKGLDAYITGFDMSYLNEIWINDKFDFSGIYTLDFEVDNLYDVRHMTSVLSIPALKVNNVPYGNWVLNASMEDPKDSVRIDLKMENAETTLTGKGAYLPPIKSIPKESQNYLRLDLIAREFPLDFLEFLLGGNIRDTEGSVDMTLSLTGKANALNPNGKGKVFNGSTVIDYLGAAYSFHDQSFTITETLIDLSGTVLYDVLGNTAVVEGGITHRYLRNLGLNATLTSDKILGLDVTSEENNVFYGRGIGQVYAVFSGTVANPFMQIQTTTAKGTHIYIPLSGGGEGVEGDFVVFLENGMLPAVKPTQINLGGINMTMNMTITEDAIVEIIFDDNTGEVLRGKGNGDLQLSMNRNGDFSMYGNYIIEEGDYLFTNFKIVRKPFVLLQGSQIQWDGDPYDATLNVQAKYKNLYASPYILIQEYLTDAQGQANEIELAKEKTEVDLTMKLTGSLLHPDIAFDIAFPSLTGTIKGYTDSKVQTLKANENAMLLQVVGLLITRSFLPSNSNVNSIATKGIDNTFSELISATLSSYLGSVFGNLIPTGEFLTSVDFQVALDIPITSGGTPELQNGELEDPNATEVAVNLPLGFFNDRLGVNVGGNYVTGATYVNQSEYWAGDVTFEYQLTQDRRLKIRAYNRNTMTVEGRKNKVGLGLAYRREYESFPEFLGKKKKNDKDTDLNE